MKVSFSVSDLNELFAEVSQQTGSTIIAGKYEQVLKFPSLIADGWMRKIQLRPGLELMIHDLKFKDNFILEAEYNKLNIAFGIGFCLTGSARGKLYGVEEEFYLNSGEGSLGFALQQKGNMEFQARQRITVVDLIMEPMMLSNFIDSQQIHIPNQLQQIINGKFNSFYAQNFEMTSVMKMAVQQILNCPYYCYSRQVHRDKESILSLMRLIEFIMQRKYY